MDSKEEKKKIRKNFFSVRVLIPFIPIFFGFYTWSGGVDYIFIQPKVISGDFNPWFFSDVRAWSIFIAYFGFWLITLLYILTDFKSKSLRSKKMIILLVLSVSFEFWGVFELSRRFSCSYLGSRFYDAHIYDELIIASSFAPILGVAVLFIFIFMSRFHTEMNYLTNLNRIKNRKIKNFRRFLEILPSFPVFMGIYHILFLHYYILNGSDKICHGIPPYTVVIIASCWLFLMIFYVFGNILVILKSRRQSIL